MNNFKYCGVDADIVAYRAAFATQEKTPKDCEESVDDLMNFIINQTVSFQTETNLVGYLTGKDNFRYEIATTYHYKGNRKDKPKPVYLPHAREYLVENWNTTVVEGIEADDKLAMEASRVGDEYVIASIDKDFATVPGWKYNWTRDTFSYDTPEEALKFFYTQILTGDTADNIVGLHRIGPKKAEKILEGLSTEEELFEACLEAYKGSETLVGDPYDRIVENARLLHLQRYEGELWQPPM